MKEPTVESRLTEAAFTATVIEFAKLYGWLVTHFRPAQTARGWRTPVQGDKGFPDCVFAKEGRVVFAELKVKGKPSEEQKAWLEALPNAYLWTPADWDSIEKVLGAPLSRASARQREDAHA